MSSFFVPFFSVVLVVFVENMALFQDPDLYPKSHRVYMNQRKRAIISATNSGRAARVEIGVYVVLASELRLLVPKTRLKPMSDELTQLEALTSGTFSGMSKVISTH